jgi:hypothetical protein
MWVHPLGYKGVNLGWTIECQSMERQQAKWCIATCVQQFQTYNWQIKGITRTKRSWQENKTQGGSICSWDTKKMKKDSKTFFGLFFYK